MPNPFDAFIKGGSAVDSAVASAFSPVNRAEGLINSGQNAYNYATQSVQGVSGAVNGKIATIQGRLANLGFPGFGNPNGSGAVSSGGIDFDIATARPDPLINVEWEVVVQFQGLNIDISPYVEDVMLPSIKLDNKQIFRQGAFVYIAKTETTASLTLKMYETSDLIAYRFFRHWKNCVRSPEGVYGTPSNYKGRILLYPLAPDKTRTAMFEARGVFPISLPSHNYSSGQPERIISEVEMSCDELVPLAAN